MKHLLPPVKRYFKANLHAHTNISDGKFSPEEVKELYKSHGYQIVAYTDHEICVPHPELDDEDFLALTSYEVATTEIDTPGMPKPFRLTYHLNLIAKEQNNRFQTFELRRAWGNVLNRVDEIVSNGEEKREYSVECMNRIIAEANAHGYLVTYNHPEWSQQTYEDYIGLKGLWGVEVFNSECYAWGYDRNNAHVYQELLWKGSRLVPIAADDFHNVQPETMSGWVMVGAEELEYGSVIKALEKGDLYATTGPEIHSLTLDGNTLHITCSDAVRIHMIPSFRVAKRLQTAPGETLREATFDLTAMREFAQQWPEHGTPFFRLEVVDAAGNTAFTRAYWFDELF